MKGSIPPSKRILVVDDEADFRAVLSFVLKRAGYEVVCAADGQEGLEHIEKARPDLVLLDVNMPRIDGKEFCRRLQAAGGNRPPVLMLTVRSEVDTAAACLNAGAADYILKPFESGDLLRRIERALGR